MERRPDDEETPESLGLVWVDCPYPVAAVGLAGIFGARARVHEGHEAPEDETPSAVVVCPGGGEGVSEAVRRVRRAAPRTLVLMFGLQLDLGLARAALRAGVRGYLHAGMTPGQITRALEVASGGELVAPRQLLEYLISNEELADLEALSARQREILDLVDEGLTNAQIARRLFLTESTVKQHLRNTYKVLGVRNRTEAARLVRGD